MSSFHSTYFVRNQLLMYVDFLKSYEEQSEKINLVKNLKNYEFICFNSLFVISFLYKLILQVKICQYR